MRNYILVENCVFVAFKITKMINDLILLGSAAYPFNKNMRQFGVAHEI